MCVQMDSALSWCPCCQPKISLKSLHHFNFHDLFPYRTSSVFPSKFHGYHVSARDCEFVFAMRSALLSGRRSSRRGPDPSLCGGVERPTSLKRIYCELARSFDSGLIRHDRLGESVGRGACVDGSFLFILYMVSHAGSVTTSGQFLNIFLRICRFIQRLKFVHFQRFFHLL